MAVSIQDGVASNLFQGVERVYLAGKMIPLLNAEGGTLIEGTAPDIAPTITRTPTILPLGAVIGDSISLDLGAATGTPQPQASWDITLNGDSIRAQLDAGAMTIELSQPGLYELSVSWSNNAGIVEAVIAGLSVEPAPEAPPIDYSQAIAYIDAGSAFQGSATNVTAITSAGRQTMVLAATGSGNPITHEPEGFTFANGFYVQSPVLSGQPTGDGMFAVIDFTLTGYGTSSGQLLQGAGSRLNLLDMSGSLRVQGVEDTTVTMTAGTTPYGRRFVIGGRIDDLTDMLGMYDLAGTYSEQPIGSTNPDLTRVITGRYLNGTLHRLAVFGRPEGGAWPVSFEDVYADFREGA